MAGQRQFARTSILLSQVKDAQEIFKDRPEAARKLVEAVAKACGGCKIPIKQDPDNNTQTAPTVTSVPGTKVDSVFREMMKTLAESTKDGKSDTTLTVML